MCGSANGIIKNDISSTVPQLASTMYIAFKMYDTILGVFSITGFKIGYIAKIAYSIAGSGLPTNVKSSEIKTVAKYTIKDFAFNSSLAIKSKSEAIIAAVISKTSRIEPSIKKTTLSAQIMPRKAISLAFFIVNYLHIQSRQIRNEQISQIEHPIPPSLDVGFP